MKLPKELKEVSLEDYLVLAMLYHNASKVGTARELEVSRTYVYGVIDRSKQLLVKLNLIDISQE